MEKIPYYNWPSPPDDAEKAAWRQALRAMQDTKSRFTADCNSRQWQEPGYGLRSWTEDVVKELGLTPLTVVVAATVQGSPWDKRYCPSIHEWANRQHFLDPDASQCRYASNSHPEFLNTVALKLREMELEREPDRSSGPGR